jgi:hypothetical protein
VARVCIAGIIGLGLIACSGAPESQEAAPAANESVEGATISVTEVGRNADGTPKVTQRVITRDQQLAMEAAREAAVAKTVNAKAARQMTPESWTPETGACSNDSQWLYDDADHTKAQNMLCLLPDASAFQLADLASFTRSVQFCFGRAAFPTCTSMAVPWTGAVRSYWNPTPSANALFDTAWFSSSTNDCRTDFLADGHIVVADACVSRARYLTAAKEGIGRQPGTAGAAEISGVYFPPNSAVTLSWYGARTASPALMTKKVETDGTGWFDTSVAATCVGEGCGCPAMVVATDSHGHTARLNIPDCPAAY